MEVEAAAPSIVKIISVSMKCEKQMSETNIIKMMSDICFLEENQISDNHPLVSDLKNEILKYEKKFGESIRTKLLAADFTFDDKQKRLTLLDESIFLIENAHFDSIDPERGSPQDVINSIDETEQYLFENRALDTITANKLLIMKSKVSGIINSRSQKK